MNSIIVWAGLIGSVLGILTSIIGIAALYRGSVIKGYAAERDFNHLRTYYQSLAEAFKFQTETFEKEFREGRKDLDTRCDRIDKDLTEIKALLFADLRSKSMKEDD